MTRKTGQTSAKTAHARDDRLKAALKANLARRKAQARARQAQPDANKAQSSNED